jgi:(p)ppGpp synthase/HD superfamily hydrolase
MARENAPERQPHISEIKELSQEFFDELDRHGVSAEEMGRITRAYHLAMRLHATQSERSDGPYTHHILRVALRVLRTPGATVDCIVASLLHDAAEDHRKKLGMILRARDGKRVNRYDRFDELFGHEVRDILALLTKKPPRLGHKKPEYKEYVLNLVSDERALLVKVSDFLDNALGILEKPVELRGRLAAKWEPVTPLLITALKDLTHEHGILTRDVRGQLIAELRIAAVRLFQARRPRKK